MGSLPGAKPNSLLTVNSSIEPYSDAGCGIDVPERLTQRNILEYLCGRLQKCRIGLQKAIVFIRLRMAICMQKSWQSKKPAKNLKNLWKPLV
jgi:hypothetical protein